MVKTVTVSELNSKNRITATGIGKEERQKEKGCTFSKQVFHITLWLGF